MFLFLSMLPIYLFGNLHCIGMCGPLVLMLGNHRYRYYYFFGRTLSFTLAGTLAGGIGAVVDVFLAQFQIPALTSLLFGGMMLVAGVLTLVKFQVPNVLLRHKGLEKVNRSLSSLLLRDRPMSTFLFGFFTVALPCGQTVIVFSACALSGDAIVGMINGFAFAVLTSPSLFFAMHAYSFFSRVKKYYHVLVGVCAMAVGALAICRGLADMEKIPHVVLNPNSPREYHIVFY